jgi:hypothetical protein
MTDEKRYTVTKQRDRWFWAAWDAFDYTTEGLHAPTYEGWDTDERAAHNAARAALGMAPLVAPLHGPGSGHGWYREGVLHAKYGATLLRYRAQQRTSPKPAVGAVYHVSRCGPHGGPTYQIFVPYHIMRRGARYLWICTTEARSDSYELAHREFLRTRKIDRQAAEAGREQQIRNGWEWWTTQLPADARPDSTPGYFTTRQVSCPPTGAWRRLAGDTKGAL